MPKAKNVKFDKYRETLMCLLSDYIREKSDAGKKSGASDGGAFFSEEDIMDREMEFTIKGILDERHLRIREALKRIDDGSYGACDECGAKIDLERLEAIPEATFCIECQKQKERHIQSLTDTGDDIIPDQLS